MNIFGYRKKRKLEELDERVTNEETARITGDQLIEENPTQRTDTTTPYYPVWYMTGSNSANYAYDSYGILEKLNTTYGPNEFAFTKNNTLDPAKYNYTIKYEVLQSNSGNQLNAGFCTKAVWNERRDGTNYAVSGGYPANFNRVNNMGNEFSIRLTAKLGVVYNNSTHPAAQFTADVSRQYDVSGATESDPWIITVSITNGEVNSIIADHSTITAIDYIKTEGWSNFPLPPGPLHMHFTDTNDSFSSGQSDWKIRVTILNRTARKDTYTLVRIADDEKTSAYESIVYLSEVENRFIPAGCKVAILQGFTDGTIDDNIYFLPQALYAGQRLFLINDSGVNLTIYNTQPDDPTSTGTADAWPSVTLSHTGNNDHMEFISLSTYEWHQIV